MYTTVNCQQTVVMDGKDCASSFCLCYDCMYRLLHCNSSKRRDDRYITMLFNDNNNDVIMLPTLPLSPFSLMGEQLRGMFNKLVRQEDDSGVNHLWKGEMWPAQVGLIHARHVQNTRGAGANN